MSEVDETAAEAVEAVQEAEQEVAAVMETLSPDDDETARRLGEVERRLVAAETALSDIAGSASAPVEEAVTEPVEEAVTEPVEEVITETTDDVAPARKHPAFRSLDEWKNR